MATDGVRSRQGDPYPAGMEVFEITPVMLGGDPVDPANKVVLTRQQHIEAVRYWNNIIRDMRNSPHPAG